MRKLNENSPVPLYFQLQEDLKKDIEMGIYKPNEMIPTEKELEKIYSVSRITVRKAIEGLVYEGVLIKKQGIGTIVSKKKVIENSLSLKSFSEKMKDQGIKVGTRVIEVARIVTSERIAEHLSIVPNEEVIYVKRLRFADDEPIGIFTSYIRKDTGVTENDDFTGSIFELFENKYKLKIAASDRTITASQVSEEEAELLGIKPGEAVLMVKYVTFDDSNRPIEYAEGLYRSDKYQYNLRYTRDSLVEK
ncbi:MAG: GntR family transcriptional regulator [Bacillota bacterium]